MKIKNPNLAGADLNIRGVGVVQFDADGCVELPTKAAEALLLTPGFSQVKKAPGATESPADPAKPLVDPEGDFVGEGALVSDGVPPSVSTSHLDKPVEGFTAKGAPADPENVVTAGEATGEETSEGEEDGEVWPPEYAYPEAIEELATKASARELREKLEGAFELELPEWPEEYLLRDMKEDLLHLVLQDDDEMQENETNG